MLSLALSVAALAYAAWVHQRAEALADEALRRRETELVRAWAPKFDQVNRDMFPDIQSRPKSPTTLVELLNPLVLLMERVGEQTEGTNSPATELPKR